MQHTPLRQIRLRNTLKPDLVRTSGGNVKHLIKPLHLIGRTLDLLSWVPLAQFGGMHEKMPIQTYLSHQ
jgi:hypothetical protein